MDKHFAKMLLNGAIGKFAQRREEKDFTWADIEKHHYYTKEGWEAVETHDTQRLYMKINGINYPTYYAPIINALTTALARIQLLKEMEKIPPEKKKKSGNS